MSPVKVNTVIIHNCSSKNNSDLCLTPVVTFMGKHD